MYVNFRKVCSAKRTLYILTTQTPDMLGFQNACPSINWLFRDNATLQVRKAGFNNHRTNLNWVSQTTFFQSNIGVNHLQLHKIKEDGHEQSRIATQTNYAWKNTECSRKYFIFQHGQYKPKLYLRSTGVFNFRLFIIMGVNLQYFIPKWMTRKMFRRVIPKNCTNETSPYCFGKLA